MMSGSGGLNGKCCVTLRRRKNTRWEGGERDAREENDRMVAILLDLKTA